LLIVYLLQIRFWTRVMIYISFFLVKALQFHNIARFYGLKGSFGQHTRAFLYGVGLNRLLPYNAGDVAIVSALEGQGEDRHKAASVIYVQDKFVVFEIICFLALSLVLTGWGMTVSQILPSIVFFCILYYLTSHARVSGAGNPGSNQKGNIQSIWQILADSPGFLIKLSVISLFAFFLDDITPFVTSQAFTGQYVHLNVPFLVIQGGVVAGYIASRVPITPAGIGQFEFGFGTALMMGGVAMPEALTIALLDGLIRNTAALVLFAIVKIWYGVETNMRLVLNIFNGTAPESVS